MDEQPTGPAGSPDPVPPSGETPATVPSPPWPLSKPSGTASLTPGFAATGASRKPMWLRPLPIAAAIALVMALGGGAFALVALRGSSDVLTNIAPADTDVYATISLDPALRQKLNLRGLVNKFPALGSDGQITQQINKLLDQAFQGSGLTFQKDVRPWLGSQVAVVDRSVSQPQVAVLVASKDDGAAEAAVDKARTGSAGRSFTWTRASRGGVDVWAGIPKSSSQDPIAYALVGHAVVLSNSAALVRDIIDVAQGKDAALDSSADYAKAVAGLPTERLGVVYVHFPPLIQQLKRALEATGSDFTNTPTVFGQLDAYRGMAVVISAQSNGVAADVNIALDPSKFTLQQRAALQDQEKGDALLPWIPKEAFGAMLFDGLRETTQAQIDQVLKADPSAKKTLDDLGVTGTDGVLAHLTGPAGFEVGPAGGGFPVGGAVLLGTDDPAGMKRFLQNAGGQLASSFDSASPGSGSSGQAAAGWQQETYRGVAISFMSGSALAGQGVQPAYAVTGGVAIVATSPEEIHRILDAHSASATKGIQASANFKEAVPHAGQGGSALFYVDAEAVVGVIRGAMGPEAQRAFDRNTAPNLRPVKAFVVSQSTTADHVSMRIFLLIR
jgi:hypothetical protein